jgi:cysteine synthase
VIHGPALRVLRALGTGAGLATACAAQELGGPCTIFLLHGVDARTEMFLRTVGANVVVAGRFYLETLRAAEVAVQMLPDTFVATVTGCPWCPSVREANIYTHDRVFDSF